MGNDKLCDIADVIDSLHKTPQYVTSGKPMVRVTDVKYGSINLEKTFKVDEIVFDEFSKRYRPSKGDIIITRVGSYGITALVEETNFCLGQNTSAIVPKINPRYLYLAINSSFVKNQVESLVGGSTQKTLSLKVINGLLIPRFPEDVEEKIANIGARLDDKIQLNQQTNQTLEKMAQTLFKSWFVDFDPVFDNALAKADFNLEALPSTWPAALVQRATLRLQVLQHNPGLQTKLTQHNLAEPENNIELAQAENTHQHFPSEFEPTDAPSIGINGWIPKGWEVVPVSKAIQVNPRTTLPKGTVAKFADMKSIPTSGYMVDEIIKKEFSGGAKFKQYDVLLARITPCLQNGKTALVDFLADDEVGFGSTEFIVLRKNKSISYPFIACLAREENFRAHCMQSMVGSSGRQRVQNPCFNDYYLALPEESVVLNYFTEFAKPNFTKMMSNKLETQSLTKIREALLPKLISGELQITNARITEKEEC
ncbi:restriction endonuclease subunit S [Psychromonas sp. SR45-3]|uniref:restriction endonuclease subunit S n=1 Tax=Psychromonas sp. SR45-3 TaxID=2760930 RepID=UPI0015FA820F|nr:restriction endonuclease subunit S [Psychromonas sp. SR45-3]MBB1272512.1 restriction endonuclease subunit S [Psychromonas sp. SR45-3]